LGQQASALDYAPVCNAESVQNADLIVVGVAAKEDGKMVIHVFEVLKGRRTDLVALGGVEVGMGDVVIKEGNKGVYLLAKYGAGYVPSNFDSYKTMNHVEAVRAAIAMLVNPGQFLDEKKSPENADIIYVLGAGFGRWSISSKEIPSLPEYWRGWRLYEEAPWGEKHVVTLQCTTDTNHGFKVSVASAEPKDALSECLKYRLMLMNFNWPTVRRSLPPRFAVTLDARLPERVGSATAEKAMSYLRDRLRSADREIVLAAILALAKMRDRDAVPRVLSLLKHEDERVRIKAIEFLGWSRDERAVKPLHSLLDAKAPHYPNYYAVCDSAARALEQIGSAESLPHLEQAACHGVERAANAVSTLGRQESFEIMLKALRDNPSQCASLDSTLYCLVRRSNRSTEPWMRDEKRTTRATRIARIPKWFAWWAENKKEFKVTKSWTEAVLDHIRVEQ
jgi:hypothetical protein